MDFVQRNLINERNNLQVELAKAKALIAELSEDLQTPGRAKEVAAEIRRRENKGDPVKGLKRLDKDEKGDMSTLIGKGGKETPAITKTGIMLGGVGSDGEMVKRNKLASHGGRGGRSVGIGKGEDSPQNMSEQAEYISDLENVIVALAESMNMSVEELMELNARNMGRLAAMARQHNAGPSNMTGFRSGLKPLGGDIQPATNVGYRLAGMLGSAGVHGAAENMQGKVVASQRHPSGGYNQDSSVISDKTPVEFKNPDVKPDTMARAAAKVRDGSKGAQQDRARTAALKAAAAERASRTF